MSVGWIFRLPSKTFTTSSHKMTPRYFFAAADIVVVGHCPEMADYENPRGELYGYRTYVVAEDALGYRRCLQVETVTSRVSEAQALQVADRMAQALNARLESGKGPVAVNTWELDQPAYGSEAYVREGCEEELIAWEHDLDGVY